MTSLFRPIDQETPQRQESGLLGTQARHNRLAHFWSSGNTLLSALQASVEY